MSKDLNEYIPSLANPIIQAIDKKKGNIHGISKVLRNGEWCVDSGPVSLDEVAGEYNNRLAWMNKETIPIFARFGEEQPPSYAKNKDIPGNKAEYRELKRDLKIVNAIRLNGPTAFVTQNQRQRVAWHLTNKLVGPRNEFISEVGSKENLDRQKEYDRVFDQLAVSLGHKRTIDRIKARKVDEQPFTPKY